MKKYICQSNSRRYRFIFIMCSIFLLVFSCLSPLLVGAEVVEVEPVLFNTVDPSNSDDDGNGGSGDDDGGDDGDDDGDDDDDDDNGGDSNDNSNGGSPISHGDGSDNSLPIKYKDTPDDVSTSQRNSDKKSKNESDNTTIYNIIKGINVTIEPENNTLKTFQNITFKPNKNYSYINYSIEEFPHNPPKAQGPPDNTSVYTYLNLSLYTNDSSLNDTEIESMNFSFKVNKTWFDEQNISNESIAFCYYENNKWQSIGANQNHIAPTDEDEDFYYYIVTSDFHSTFAIIGNEYIETDPFTPILPMIPIIFIVGFIFGASIIFIVVLFKAEYIYTDKKQKDSH